jgi:hypothetical protein
MKLIFLSLTFVAICMCGYAQSNVPEVVQQAFAQKYSNAKNVEWEEEEEGAEVSFTFQRKKMEAFFDNKGNWVETEQQVRKRQLPASVKRALKTEYKGYKIDELEYVTQPKDVSFYELELEKDGEAVELVFSKAGELISKEVEEEDTDDE